MTRVSKELVIMSKKRVTKAKNLTRNEKILKSLKKRVFFIFTPIMQLF